MIIGLFYCRVKGQRPTAPWFQKKKQKTKDKNTQSQQATAHDLPPWHHPGTYLAPGLTLFYNNTKEVTRSCLSAPD